MERTAGNLWKLFRATFSLSAFTFGGGYVIVPLMRRKFVEELGWIEEEDMLNLVAIAQSAPGAMAVNTSILAGWRLMGIVGAAVSLLGTILPPMVVISVVSLFYAAFKDNAVVSAVLKGMMAGVSAVILDVVIGMAGQIVKLRKVLPVLLMAGAFVAHFVLGVNVIYIILCCIALGALVSVRDRKSENGWLR